MSHHQTYNNVYCNCLKKKYGRNPFTSDIINSNISNDPNFTALIENKKRSIGTYSNSSNNMQLSTVILKGRGRSVLVKNDDVNTTTTCGSILLNYNKF